MAIASVMMHLYAAREVARLQSFTENQSQYYLGAIAPDSVNLRGFAEKEIRWNAHLREQHIPDWYRRVAEFYRQSHGQNALALGYSVHCLTDAVFDLLFADLVWEKRRASELEDLHGIGLCWDDCMRFDFEQKNKAWWQEEVRPALEASDAVKIGSVEKEGLEGYRNWLMQEYFSTLKQGGPLVVSAHLVEALGRAVSDLMREYGIAAEEKR